MFYKFRDLSTTKLSLGSIVLFLHFAELLIAALQEYALATVLPSGDIIHTEMAESGIHLNVLDNLIVS